MSDNEKYYYLKVKDNFFDREEMKILESMKNGEVYQLLYLKLCLLSLKNNGQLIFKDMIPYNIEMLSSVLRINVDTVKTAIEIFKKIELLDIVDSEIIYMTDLQTFIGKSSTEAERVKKHRLVSNCTTDLQVGNRTNVRQVYDNRTTSVRQSYEERTTNVQDVCTNVHPLEVKNLLNVQKLYECTPEIRDKRLENKEEKENKEKNSFVCWVEKIKKAHPAINFPADTSRAIMVAIESEMAKGSSLDDAAGLILLATDEYRKAVSAWSPERKKYIVRSLNWFSGGCYLENPESWQEAEAVPESMGSLEL